ncbi:MAG: hypothetical protein QNJ20_12910 [Paracoccaceae bacterium]|nr:hypothetical protein [Paracoccaceae bacterium]
MTLVRKQIAKDDLHTVSEEYWDGDLEGLADFLNFQRSFEERLQAIAFSLDDELERRGLPRWCWKVIIEKDRENWHVDGSGERLTHGQSFADASVSIRERAEPPTRTRVRRLTRKPCNQP